MKYIWKSIVYFKDILNAYFPPVTGINLGMGLANERRCYDVAPPLIG